MIFTAPFWRGAGERAIRTFFQAALAAALLQKATFVTGLDWFLVANTAALAAVISLMTSVSNSDFVAGHDGLALRRGSDGRFVSGKQS